MNQKANPADDQDHHTGEMIEQQAKLRLKRARLDPREIVFQNRRFRLRLAEHGEKKPERNQKGDTYGSRCDEADDILGQSLAHDAIGRGAHEGQNWYEPQQVHKLSVGRMLNQNVFPCLQRRGGRALKKMMPVPGLPCPTSFAGHRGH